MNTPHTDITPDQYLDARGLNCPLPVLKAKLALNRMQPGQVLHVEATDPHAPVDFHAWCARTGNEMLDTTHEGDVLGFFIRRSENATG